MAEGDALGTEANQPAVFGSPKGTLLNLEPFERADDGLEAFCFAGCCYHEGLSRLLAERGRAAGETLRHARAERLLERLVSCELGGIENVGQLKEGQRVAACRLPELACDFFGGSV